MDSPANSQKLAYKDALSLADQSAYYNANGTPCEPSGHENVTFGEDTTMGSGLDDNNLSSKSDETGAKTVWDDNATVKESSIVSNKTLVSKRLAGSITCAKHYANEWDKFNNELGRIKDHHTQEMADLQKQMEILKTNQLTVGPTPVEVQETPPPNDPTNQATDSTVGPTPPEVQETPPPNGLTNQATGDAKDPTSESDEDKVEVDNELDTEIKDMEAWMHRNDIPIPPESTTEETVPTAPADPPNQANSGAAASPG